MLSGSSLAGIEPMLLDESVGFEHVGGHDDHILALKESIILPLMYPEVFSGFGIDPPRGVLFTGPPGKSRPSATCTLCRYIYYIYRKNLKACT